MKFEWDEAKNRVNIRKHGFDFAEGEEMFRGILLVRPDTDEHLEEERRIRVGMIHGRVAFVAFNLRSEDTIRIISLRKAAHEERKQYEEALQNGLEAG